VLEQVRDTPYYWAEVVKGYPFSFVIWGSGGGGVGVPCLFLLELLGGPIHANISPTWNTDHRTTN